MQSILLSASPALKRCIIDMGYWSNQRKAKKNKKTKQTQTTSELERMILDGDVGRNISSSHALKIKQKYNSISKEAKLLNASSGKLYRDVKKQTGKVTTVRKGKVANEWIKKIQDFFFREDMSR